MYHICIGGLERVKAIRCVGPGRHYFFFNNALAGILISLYQHTFNILGLTHVQFFFLQNDAIDKLDWESAQSSAILRPGHRYATRQYVYARKVRRGREMVN